jgi:hypothetical protein
MSRNFRLEAEMKEAAVAAGCLESALPDFEMDVQTYAVTSAAEIPKWIEKCKTAKPHRFAVQTDHDAELCQKAFLFKHKTSESQLYRAVGEQRFNELKQMYASGLPESEKKRLNGSADHSKNPWRATPDNLEPNSNRYSAAAFKAQVSIVKSLGLAKAAALAAACGARVGDVRAPKVAA